MNWLNLLLGSPSRDGVVSLSAMRLAADRFACIVAAGCLLWALLIGYGFGTLYEAIALGTPLLGLSLLANRLAAGQKIAMYLNTLVLTAFATLHVHLSRGMPEFHFSYFVLMSILLYYRCIGPIVAFGAGAIVLHIVLDFFQRMGFDCFVFRGMFTGMPAIALHGSYLLAQSMFLAILANVLQKNALLAEETTSLIQRLTCENKNGVIDIRNTFRPDETTGEISPIGKAYNDYAENMVHIIGAFKMLKRDMISLTETASELSAFAKEQVETTQRSASQVKSIQKISSDLTFKIEAGGDDISDLKARLKAMSGAVHTTDTDLRGLRDRFNTSKNKVDELFKEFLGVQSSIITMKNLSLKIHAITHPMSTGEVSLSDPELLKNLNSEFMKQTQQVESAVHQYNSAVFEVMQTISRFGEQISDASNLLNSMDEEIDSVYKNVASVEGQVDRVLNLQVSGHKLTIDLLSEYDKSNKVNEGTISKLQGSASNINRARALVLEMDSRLSKFSV